MISRRFHSAWLFAGLLLTLLLFPACDSPLTVETPRNRYVDNISVQPGQDIGSAVSVLIPVDTTGSDTLWIPAHFSAALVFDASGSISTQMNQYLKKAGNTFLDSLDGYEDEGLVVHFTETATIFQHLTTAVPPLRNAVNALPMTGATAMWDGIYIAMLELQTRASHARQAVIIITDSDDNSSVIGNASNIIDFATRNNIMVYTIAMSITSHELTLRNIAETTNGRHYSQPLLSSLDGIYREIAASLRRP
jgi:hypothetical protein